MSTLEDRQDVIESLNLPAGLIRTAAKTINQFLDECDAQARTDKELNAFDAMSMADLILQQVQVLEQIIGELELIARQQAGKIQGGEE